MHHKIKRLLEFFPNLYWELTASSFAQESWQQRLYPQHTWLLKQITQTKPATVLEVGCGFGRNLQFLLDNGYTPKQLTGTDISGRMIALSKKKLPTQVTLEKAPITCLPFRNSSFDVVFTHGVLMHVKPSQLPDAFVELIRVTKKTLLLIEETRTTPQPINRYTWAHDYQALIKKHCQLTIVEKQVDDSQLVWMELKVEN